MGVDKDGWNAYKRLAINPQAGGEMQARKQKSQAILIPKKIPQLPVELEGVYFKKKTHQHKLEVWPTENFYGGKWHIREEQVRQDVIQCFLTLHVQGEQRPFIGLEWTP